MRSRVSLTAVIITLNGERLLDKCLESAGFCDQILIVDSFSTDSTENIARAHGAFFVRNPWPGNAGQIRFGVDWLRDNAPSDWVLFLDCDEICTAELAASIQSAIAGSCEATAFSFSRLTWYYDRFLRHGGANERLFRLFRPEAIRIAEHGAHQEFVPTGPHAHLSGALLHYTYAGFFNQVAKLNDYAERGGKDLRNKGRAGGILPALGHGIWRFLAMYLLHLGILDGRAGFLLAAHTAFYTFMKYVRINESDWGAPYISQEYPAYVRPASTKDSEQKPMNQPEGQWNS